MERSGTGPFMALDRIQRPNLSVDVLPRWHLPRYDVESFIWVFCWTLHHFGPITPHSNERQWVESSRLDRAFYNRDHLIARTKKLQWASALPTKIPISWSIFHDWVRHLVLPIVLGYTDADHKGALIRAELLYPGLDGFPPRWFHDLGGRITIDTYLAFFREKLQELERRGL